MERRPYPSFRLAAAKMIPYFVVLFVSGASAALAFRTPDKRNSTLFSLVAILAPCLLAAFRDPTVGVDVLTYAEPSFYSAISRNIWEYIASSDNEPLFSLLAYVSATFFNRLLFTIFLSSCWLWPLFTRLSRITAPEAFVFWPGWFFISRFLVLVST